MSILIKQNHQLVSTPGGRKTPSRAVYLLTREDLLLFTDEHGRRRQALCLGKRVIWKNHEETEEKEGEAIDKHLRPLFPLLADHLSARSLSVTWIHWDIINCGRQATNDFYLVPNCCFFQWVFSLGLTEQMWFLPLLSYWEVVTRILIYCSYRFWLAWFSLWCKNILVELF